MTRPVQDVGAVAPLQKLLLGSLLLVKVKTEGGDGRVELGVLSSEYPQEQRAKKLTVPITQLEYTQYNKPLSQDSRTIVSLVGDESGETGSQSVGDSLGLHEYRDCDNYDLKETDTVYEPSALRFFSELVKHYSKYA